jgi:DNA-binding FadR family transcriptional regulator
MTRRTKPETDSALSRTLRQTVEALRKESLGCPEGELIGSEDELLARLRVSRPTLRQAAALVAQEQLLEVRRGVRGGYLARRPTGRAVAHMAAIFLSTREASIDEISESMTPLRAELVRLAASNLDDTSRPAFRGFLQREAGAIAEGGGFRAFAKSERDFSEVLGAASRNIVLSLFLNILNDLAARIRPEHDVFLGRPERVRAYRERRARLTEAILAGDASVAVLLSHRVSALIQSWWAEDGRRAHPASAELHDLTGSTDQV